MPGKDRLAFVLQNNTECTDNISLVSIKTEVPVDNNKFGTYTFVTIEGVEWVEISKKESCVGIIRSLELKRRNHWSHGARLDR